MTTQTVHDIPGPCKARVRPPDKGQAVAAGTPPNHPIAAQAEAPNSVRSLLSRRRWGSAGAGRRCADGFKAPWHLSTISCTAFCDRQLSYFFQSPRSLQRTQCSRCRRCSTSPGPWSLHRPHRLSESHYVVPTSAAPQSQTHSRSRHGHNRLVLRHKEPRRCAGMWFQARSTAVRRCAALARCQHWRHAPVDKCKLQQHEPR
jgi:hypothetical protein